MARVLLVSGYPGQGKTTLAERLGAAHGFDVISVDPVYVEFIQSYCPKLYFEDLHLYIAQHYEIILGRDPTKVHAWHEHLFTTIAGRSDRCDSLVVEGYLLFDCKDDYAARLAHRSVEVFQIHAEHRSYRLIHNVTVEQIATLDFDTNTGSSRTSRDTGHGRDAAHRIWRSLLRRVLP